MERSSSIFSSEHISILARLATRRQIGLAVCCVLLALVPFLTIDRLDLHIVAVLTFGILIVGLRLLPEYRRHMVFFFLSLVLFVLIGEICFRVMYFGPAGLSFRSYRPAGYGSPWSTFEYDPSSFTGLKPGSIAMLRGKPFRVNSHGFRGRDVESSKPEDVYRIVLTGASAMMGPGIDEDAIAPVILEKILNERDLPMKVQVVNLSVGATRIPEMLFVLQHAAPLYQPDMELLLANRNLLPALPLKPAFKKARHVNEPLWRLVLNRKYNFCSECFFLLNLILDFRHDTPRALCSRASELLPLTQEKPADADLREKIISVLDQFTTIASPAQPVIFLLRPIMATDERELEKDYRTLLKELAPRYSTPLIDTYDLDLAAFRPSDLILYPGDNHPNETAHRIFAEHMAGVLEPIVRKDMLSRKDRKRSDNREDDSACF